MFPIRLDHNNLCPEIGGLRFNASIIESGDGYLYTFRDAWRQSDLYGAWLDKDFQPTGKWAKIEIPKGACHSRGREDGRLFRLNGKLHLAFVGFTGRSTSVLYAALNEETLAVEKLIWPQLNGANRKEKSWSMFDYAGELHSIYSINPHIILTFNVNNDGDTWAERTYRTDWDCKWTGGPLRGGASPVLHDGKWFHFFHGCTVQENGRRLYNMGLVTFENSPPFRILEYTPEPLDVADPNAEPKAEKSDVIFPCGAVRYGDGWAVSMGVNDQWTEIRFYSDEMIQERLHAAH